MKKASAFINEKQLVKTFQKKTSPIAKEKFIRSKYSFNPRIYSNLQLIIDNENEEDSITDLSQDEEYNENREKQLKILNEKYTKLYDSKEKIYANIIKEIDVEKQLFYKGSIMSFKLFILKIKCLLKILKDKFEIDLNSKDERTYSEVEIYIQKIKNEFKKIYSILNEESKFEYEELTQIYCKYLYIIAIIANHKEEYIKSFSYITLGVNMLKVFFIRQKIATDIETYKIYAKLTILLINKLLNDNNITQALIYINLLSRISEIGLNIVYKNKLNKKYEYRFNKYNGYNYLFLGYCYELKNNIPNNIKLSVKIYNEAFYFMIKSNNLSLFTDTKSEITIEKKALCLSQLLYEKLKDKLLYEALEKQKEYEQQEKIKKQLLEEAKTREKKFKLQMIASGFTPERENIKKIKYKLYKEILNPKNQQLIDKLDDEIISYVYKNKQNQNDNKDIIKIKSNVVSEKKLKNKKCGKLEKRLPSIDIMKNLCHYKMYNSLMSDDFKEFILTNKKLEFNYPIKQKNSLDKIQKFLNRKIEIESNLEHAKKDKAQDDRDKEILYQTETNISSEKTIKTKILNLKKINNKKIKLTNINNNNTENISNYIKFIKNQSRTTRPFTASIKHSYIISRDKDKDKNKNNKVENNNKRLNTCTNNTVSRSSGKNNSNKHNKGKKINFNSKSLFTNYTNYMNFTNYTTNSIDFENRKLDKYIFNNKYFREYIYFDKLTNKELNFQKQFLESKNNNSKMYFRSYDTELQNNGRISRDEIYNSFLILNNNAVNKNRNYEKEIKAEKEIKNKPIIIGNVFKSVTNKMKEGKEVKNAMMKVLEKYRKNNRQKIEQKNKTPINIEDINKKNEFSIMKLNDNIKEISSLLISKSNEAKKVNNFVKYADI